MGLLSTNRLILLKNWKNNVFEQRNLLAKELKNMKFPASENCINTQRRTSNVFINYRETKINLLEVALSLGNLTHLKSFDTLWAFVGTSHEWWGRRTVFRVKYFRNTIYRQPVWAITPIIGTQSGFL